MYKKIFVGFIALALACVSLYFVFKPKTNSNDSISTLANFTDNTELLYQSTNYNDLNKAVKEFEDGVYVFVLTDNSTDSKYLVDTILYTLSTEATPSPLPCLISIDMNDIGSDTVTRLKNKLGVESFPALIEVHIKNGEYSVDSTLKYNGKTTSIDDVRAWLFKNKLWDAPYIEKAESEE